MPRSIQQVIDQADEYAARFEAFEPAESREVAALRAAASRRQQAEIDVKDAVLAAAAAGAPWKDIGAAVGTSGQADHARYRSMVDDTAS